MTTFTPICSYCTHFDASVRDREVCKAFPDGIPKSILDGKADHREPVEGDHNIQFDAKPGFEEMNDPDKDYSDDDELDDELDDEELDEAE